MPGIQHFEAFLAACLLLNLTPGNDTVFLLARSLAGGRRAGLAAALGIGTGCLVHTILAAVGLSAVIASSATLFSILKFAGAAYLVLVGIQMLRTGATLEWSDPGDVPRRNAWRVYRDGLLTNVLNPKVALFFLAFLPQFVDPAHGSAVVPLLLLGATFTTTGTLWGLLLVVFAGGLSRSLRRHPRRSLWITRACGATLVGLGIKVSLLRR